MSHASSSSVVGHQLTTKACQEFESGFKGLTRGVIGVAVGLSHNKEVKDFFVQLLEKLVEPLRAMQVTKADIDVFLNEYTRYLAKPATLTELASFSPGALRSILDIAASSW